MRGCGFIVDDKHGTQAPGLEGMGGKGYMLVSGGQLGCPTPSGAFPHLMLLMSPPSSRQGTSEPGVPH